MRQLRTGIAAGLAAAVIVQAHTGAQVASTPFEANRIVCADEGARLIGDLRKEVKAAQQTTWTAEQERERLEADLKAVLDDRELGPKFAAAFPGLWKDATDFLQKPELVVAACALAVAEAWQAGVRDVATMRQRWAEAQSTTYKLPGATAPPPSSHANVEDPSATEPVDCVRLDDKPGAFKNDCTFDVYFTYCGINPAKDSWVAECSKQSFGLIDIGARGVQGGFTRAEKIYFFECRSPATPFKVEYREGEGLFGYCKR